MFGAVSDSNCNLKCPVARNSMFNCFFIFIETNETELEIIFFEVLAQLYIDL